MIQKQSILEVVDNCGAKRVRCIGIIGGNNTRSVSIGDEIVVSVQTISKKKRNVKIQKGQVYRAIVVGTKNPILRNDGTSIRFKKSVVVLVDNLGAPLGTRIVSPIALELRKKRLKLVSIASDII